MSGMRTMNVVADHCFANALDAWVEDEVLLVQGDREDLCRRLRGMDVAALAYRLTDGIVWGYDPTAWPVTPVW